VRGFLPRIDILARQRREDTERHSASFFADWRKEKSVEIGSKR